MYKKCKFCGEKFEDSFLWVAHCREKHPTEWAHDNRTDADKLKDLEEALAVLVERVSILEREILKP